MAFTLAWFSPILLPFVALIDSSDLSCMIAHLWPPEPTECFAPASCVKMVGKN